jgi:hypothetical protein
MVFVKLIRGKRPVNATMTWLCADNIYIYAVTSNVDIGFASLELTVG